MKIDKMAISMFGEFGFATCNEEQQQVIIKKILDITTIRLMSK